MPLQTHSTKQWKKAIVVQILLFFYTLSLHNDRDRRTLFYVKSDKLVLIGKEMTSYDNGVKAPTENSYEVFELPKETWNVFYSTRRLRSSLIWMLSGTFCVDIKRKHFCHASCSNIRLETICLSAPEIGNWKEQGVIIIFFVISTSIYCSGALEILLGF